MPKRRFFRAAGALPAACLLLWLAGCSRARAPEPAPGGILASDTALLPAGDPAGPGPLPVAVEPIEVSSPEGRLDAVLYRPVAPLKASPAVVFLPGRMAGEDQYDSYARALASRGFVVAVRGWYSPFRRDSELAGDAGRIAAWLVQAWDVDPGKIGVAGHSMGGKDAVLAAVESGRFAGLVAIDPDDNGALSVARGVIERLRVPLLLIGAEVAWKAASVCAPTETNYRRFFERAPAGTIELTLRDADHVQMLDDPDRFGYGLCRCGTADSRQVRITARRATVGFFVQHLQNGPALDTPSTDHARVRVAREFPTARRNGGPPFKPAKS